MKCANCESANTIWVQINDCLWAKNFGGTLQYGIPKILEDLIACLDCGFVKSKNFKPKDMV